MKNDLYTRVVLTIIAICLAALAFQSGRFETAALAETPITCSGELKANSSGGTQAHVGGYSINVRCK